MGSCSFCNENERETYWSHYCKDCAMLRRMLVLHDPAKCVNILKRCLIRNADQIDNKIKIELKNGNDLVDYDKPLTRKQKQDIEIKKITEK